MGGETAPSHPVATRPPAAQSSAPAVPSQATPRTLVILKPSTVSLPPEKPQEVAAPAPVPSSEKPKSAPPAIASSSHPDRITVGRGETLYMIARRYDLPLRALIDANHLDPPFQPAAGTVLRLPQARYHIVQAGETLYAVSRTYGVEVSTLASLNHLSEPYAIRSGQALALPPQVLPQESAATPTPAAKPEPALPSPPSGMQASPPPPAVAAVPPEPKPRAGRLFAWPLEGRIIEGYGTGASGTHNDGINIAARAGEPVRAADAGRVAYAGNELRGYGNLVLIKHAGGYMTAYAHNGKLLVKRGEAVKRGQEIATAGATGSVNSPQLHFEIRRGTHALDPTDHLPDLRASAN